MSLNLYEIEKIDKERDEKWNNPLGIIEKNEKRYIDEEEILLEVKLIPWHSFLFRIFLIFCMFLGAYVLYENKHDSGFYIYISSLIFMIYIPIFLFELLNLYRYKLFITEDSFITYRGLKTNKNDIYFKLDYMPLLGSTQWKLYDNKSLICIYVEGTSEESVKFLDLMYKLSRNKIFYKDQITCNYVNMLDLKARNKKIKLI